MSTRIRTLKPEWLEDEQLAEAGTFARLLSVSLIVLADDHGRGRANEVVLAAKVFTYESDPVGCLREALASLSRISFVVLYTVRGQRYYQIRNWAKHQRVDKPSKPRFPGPDESDGEPSPPATKPPSDPGNKVLSRNPRESLAPDLDLDPDRDPDPDQRSFVGGAASDQVARAPEQPAPKRQTPPPQSAIEVVERMDEPYRLAASAYKRAIESAGGIWDEAAKWRTELVHVGSLAEKAAQRDGDPVRAVLERWAAAYLSERDKRRPDWWLEWVTAHVSGASKRTSHRGRLAPIDNPAGFETGGIVDVGK